MVKEESCTVYIGFGTMCSFRQPLGVLECIPVGKSGLLYMKCLE